MRKIKKPKLLLAVSGGPDSMFMLNKYRKHNIIVAHVNYNKREDSWKDENIVSEFCKKNNIPFFNLSIQKYEDKINNFQSYAREIRYNFFKKIYTENHCDFLYIAHNKDDFFENVILQKQQNKIVNYWGIKKETTLYNMKVFRPFVFKLWKKQIEKLNFKNGVNFAIDYTNNLSIYERNKVRLKYKNNKIQKAFIFYFYRFKNLFFIFKNKKTSNFLHKWEKKNFDINFLKHKNEKFILNVIYNLINQKFLDINLSKQKLLSIKIFLFSKNRTSSFKLKDDVFLIKKQNKLIFN